MKKILRYSFTVLIVLSCLIVVPFTFVRDTLESQKETAASTTLQFVPTTRPRPTTTTTVPVTEVLGSNDANNTVSTTTTTAPTAPTLSQTPEEAFADTLFIGDSRTYGFVSYNIDVPGATFFCAEGMSSYNVLKNAVDVPGMGKLTLAELLGKKQFKQVYMMFGLNEIGYDIGTTAVKYQQIIGKIAELQPNAAVIVQSTLHVTKSVNDKNTDSGKVFNNARINKLNALLAQLVDEPFVYYVDVNEAFDDATGSMAAGYAAGDGMHINVRSYTVWRDFLFEKRVM